MSTIVTTLFEGDYHLGAAALINSLCASGFTGKVICGHRGPAPAWANQSAQLGAVQVQFLELHTEMHLTNFKPEFLLQAWNGRPAGVTKIFYFDPDITIRAPWSFFEEWSGYGVALVEDVNSPLPESHPRRAAWRHCLRRRPKLVRRELSIYVNGGFIGLDHSHVGFLYEWIEAMSLVGKEIGGLAHSMFSFGDGQASRTSPTYPYSKTDQDALNIAVMTASQPVSIMGAEAMDFKAGGWTMAHALGPDKPWRKQILWSAFRARPPTSADREYWTHAAKPIPAFSPGTVAWRRVSLQLASALGRFYRRA
jgi:hypothetical protein